MSPSCPGMKLLSQLHAQSGLQLRSLHAALSTVLVAATQPALHAGASVGDAMYPTPSARGTLTPRHRYSNPGDQGPEGAAYQEEGLDPVQEVPAGRGYHADAQQGPYPQGVGYGEAQGYPSVEQAQPYVSHTQEEPRRRLTGEHEVHSEAYTQGRVSNYSQYDPGQLPHPAAQAAAATLALQGQVAAPPQVTFDIEQGGEVKGPLEEGQQGREYQPDAKPLARTQTLGKVEGPHHPSALEAFPAAAGVADVDHGRAPGAGIGGDQRWQAPQEPAVPVKGEAFRKVEWARKGQWKWNICWPMVLIVLAWFVVTIIYIVVRATKSLKLGHLVAYGVWVLVVEGLGASTLLLYAFHLCLRPRKFTPPTVRQPFSVRIMIPCYKEDIETLEETLECAIEAAKVSIDKGMANAAHVYLCDDSPKGHTETYNGQTFGTAALHQQMIDALYRDHGIPIIRVTRNKTPGGETNPKSSNLNNCLRQIYGDSIPPPAEVVAVFDADQAAHNFFFTSVLPWMDAGEDVAVVQSPQVFRGVHWLDDVLNHENISFWHYLQPAYSIMGFISCAGTNFLIRANAFAQAGWFPTHTLTEDYALGMEMRRRGWREVYVEDELVRGSAPDKVRGAFGQRSRWCKGPYQMLFSKKSPVFAPGLSLLDRILYTSPCYIYVVSGLATPTFLVVPLIYIWAGRFPAVLTTTVISWLIAYSALSFFVKYYVRPGRSIIHDIKSHWNAEVSTKNFWWMYFKAAARGSMSKCGCLNLGWTPGAGGKKVAHCYTKLCEARGDLYPHMFSAFCLTITIIYGFFMVGAGAEFVGPLGISIVWAIYHAISPWLLVLYVFFPFKHEVRHKKVFYNVGRYVFLVIVNICFVASFACFFAAIILAYKTKNLGAYNSGYNNGVYHLGVKETFSYLRHGKPASAG